jgi:hypothetical protein
MAPPANGTGFLHGVVTGCPRPAGNRSFVAGDRRDDGGGDPDGLVDRECAAG